MEKQILKAFSETEMFLNTSFIRIQESNKDYWAFPHFKGKLRATECGGTSSGLSALKLINEFTYNNEMKIQYSSAFQWLVSKQKENGSWQSAGIYCSEVTARIICDLSCMDCRNDTIIINACNFLVLCFNENGFFCSTINANTIPRIYTTYICVLALSKYGKLENVKKERIIEWIEKSKSHDNNWGAFPGHDYGTISHTIFALNILYLCGVNIKEIKKKYSRQIKWIKQQAIEKIDIYDVEEIREKTGIDEYGTKYRTSITQHNVTALFGYFFLNFGYLYYATIIVKKMLHTQCAGGWGPSRDRLAMWACQQNVEFLINYRNNYITLPKIEQIYLKYLRIFTRKIFIVLGFFFTASIIGWLLLKSERIEALIISIIASLVCFFCGYIINKVIS